MHIQLFFTLIGIFLSTGFVFGNETSRITTSLNKATVFTEGAQLFRTKKIELKTGENTLRFINLEQDINANSIQLYGIGESENFTVISTQFILEESSSLKLLKSIPVLEDSIRRFERKISVLNYKVLNLKKEKDLIFAHQKISQESEETFIDRLSALTVFYREKTNEIDQLIYDYDREKNKLAEAKRATAARLREKQKKQHYGVIEAKVYATKVMSQNVKLTYMVSNAGWTPFYEIKSGGINTPLRVKCKATVKQSTGINWKNINITLSTRKPEVLHSIPEIHPWVLYFQKKLQVYQQQNQLINQQVYSNTALPLNQSISVAPKTDHTNTWQYLSGFKHATHKMINKEYKSNLRYNIDGNNGMAVVELDKFEMETEYIYYTVPKYDQNVYLVAEVERWEQHDLIPAFANIFLEGSYIGKLFIDPTTINDKLNLMLGRDQNIVVERRKINQNEERQRKIINGTETTELGIEITIKNKKSLPVQMVIKDQVPVSGHEEIEVNHLDISKADLDKKTGILTWKYIQKPKETKTFMIKYEVKRPKQKKIAGF